MLECAALEAEEGERCFIVSAGNLLWNHERGKGKNSGLPNEITCFVLLREVPALVNPSSYSPPRLLQFGASQVSIVSLKGVGKFELHAHMGTGQGSRRGIAVNKAFLLGGLYLITFTPSGGGNPHIPPLPMCGCMSYISRKVHMCICQLERRKIMNS